MTNKTIVAVLPIGEFNSDTTQHAYETIIGVFNHLDTTLLIAASVTDAEEARQSVQELSEKNPDLFLVISLRGFSAQVIEKAGKWVMLYACLAYPGEIRPSSSTLAFGALGAPVFR